MEGILATFAVSGAWLVLMLGAAVVTLPAYAGTVLLSFKLVGLIGVIIAAGAIAARRPSQVRYPAMGGYGWPANHTMAPYTPAGVQLLPAAGPAWHGQCGWALVPAATPTVGGDCRSSAPTRRTAPVAAERRLASRLSTAVWVERASASRAGPRISSGDRR